MAKQVRSGQGSLFDALPKPAAPAGPVGPRPWDTLNAADAQLGWAYRWVTPARAREIRAEVTG